MENHVTNGTCQSKDYAANYDLVKGVADFLLSKTDVRPRIGLVCGTGMGTVPDMIRVKNVFDYSEIPHFPISTVAGHAGQLIFGYIANVPVMCMKGRVHYFEGYDINECVLPVRVMKLCGVTHLIMSNAAGALNENFKIGDIMILNDHINFLGLAGVSPLRGLKDERWGPRFLPAGRIYDKVMRQKAKLAAEDLGVEEQFHEGVYAIVGGPNFETPAECRMLRLLGIDTVGMSTATEALAAHHCGLKVFAFSLVTNICITDNQSERNVSHEEILDSGFRRELLVRGWISKLVALIADESKEK